MRTSLRRCGLKRPHETPARPGLGAEEMFPPGVSDAGSGRGESGGSLEGRKSREGGAGAGAGGEERGQGGGVGVRD